MTNLRAYYAEHYGITIPSDFRILHIDGKKSNTHISNLLLVPKELYEEYSRTYCNLCRVGLSFNFKKALQAAMKDDHQCDDFIAALEEFYEMMHEMFGWVTSKHFEDLMKAGVPVRETSPYNYNYFRI